MVREGLRFQAGTRLFSLLQNVSNVSGAHPAYCSMGTAGSFLEGKASLGVKLTVTSKSMSPV